MLTHPVYHCDNCNGEVIKEPTGFCSECGHPCCLECATVEDTVWKHTDCNVYVEDYYCYDYMEESA